MSTEVRWLTEPEDHDYPAALDYLELLIDLSLAEQVVSMLEEAPVVSKKAKDILRASTLPLLSENDPHVAKDLHKIKQGHALSPVLLARGDNLIIADGYHRVCACYHVDPNTEISCKLV
jgi:hypothetical protein